MGYQTRPAGRLGGPQIMHHAVTQRTRRKRRSTYDQWESGEKATADSQFGFVAVQGPDMSFT